MLHFQSPPSTISQSSRWTEHPPLHYSQRGPYGERGPSPEPSQVPGRQAPFQVPQQGPQGECVPSPGPSPVSFRIPSKGNPLRFPLTELPRRELLPFRSPHSLSLLIPSKWSPAFPHWGPYGKRHPFPELSSTRPLIIHLSLKVPGKWALLRVPH